MVTDVHVVYNDLLKWIWVFKKESNYKRPICIRLNQSDIKQDLGYSIIHLVFYIYLFFFFFLEMNNTYYLLINYLSYSRINAGGGGVAKLDTTIILHPFSCLVMTSNPPYPQNFHFPSEATAATCKISFPWTKTRSN